MQLANRRAELAVAAVATMPKESIEAVAKSIPSIIAALLTTAGVPFSCEGLKQSCPSAASLHAWVVELASEIIANNRAEMKYAPAFSLSIDKGERSKLSQSLQCLPLSVLVQYC
jgi:hypothetical protein